MSKSAVTTSTKMTDDFIMVQAKDKIFELEEGKFAPEVARDKPECHGSYPVVAHTGRRVVSASHAEIFVDTKDRLYFYLRVPPSM